MHMYIYMLKYIKVNITTLLKGLEEDFYLI